MLKNPKILNTDFGIFILKKPKTITHSQSFFMKKHISLP